MNTFNIFIRKVIEVFVLPYKTPKMYVFYFRNPPCAVQESLIQRKQAI